MGVKRQCLTERAPGGVHLDADDSHLEHGLVKTSHNPDIDTDDQQNDSAPLIGQLLLVNSIRRDLLFGKMRFRWPYRN